MSPELELYLERKAICLVDGIPEPQAVATAWKQVKPMLEGKPMLWEIFKDLKAHGIDPKD